MVSKDETTTETAAVEPAPVKKTRAKAAKPEVVAEAPEKVEHEFLDELPHKTDTRVTKAIEGDETEPKKVEADKAFDLGTQQTPAVDGRPEAEPAPAVVDQPKIEGVSKDTDTRVTAYIEEGETEPKPVKHEDTFAEDHHDQPNPGKIGGEPAEDEYLAAASMEEAEKPEGGKAKTTNPKLKRLSKYREPKHMP